MSERILHALMQLFAIIARVDEVNEESISDDEITSSRGRKIVKLFLKQELNAEIVDQYLKLFDQFLTTHHGVKKKKDGRKKRLSVNSVKVLRICSEINSELLQRQKIIVLIRIIEFILTNKEVSDQEFEFVDTVRDVFNVPDDEYKIILKFVQADDNILLDAAEVIYLVPEINTKWKYSKQLKISGLDNYIGILRVKSVDLFFFRYLGNEQIKLNGQVINSLRQHVFTPGSSLRTPKINPVYYSDIISHFISDRDSGKILFKVTEVSYQFKNKEIGLHNIDFEENSGRLIGIMGASGAGKSTLLNVLNGNYTPTEGSVTINGINIHKEKEKIEGVIGFVSQDDLLIDELTVFQNLFYNAKLCFKDLSDKNITKRVIALLRSIGLYESKDLKVGNPLEKTISGGQRKRLNISLELIREPSILFVDEPTSGLSSRDSENIMDLLKELALKGKLVFVVIHQPSSDIFKMFDKLLIMDQGGYPIFYGNPVDSVVHFKTLINHVNYSERECPRCGNVNPEQIFNIIEAKVVDEFGNQTDKRKISAEEWYQYYLQEKPEQKAEDSTKKIKKNFKIPGYWKQFKVFFTRDILAKLTNKQYLIINTIEAPLLALVLAFFVKYFKYNDLGGKAYTFENSENIPQFLFIAVVVALFIGLTVAAEEIIKDQKILKRESFLNLSKRSYLFSKISILFIISAIQTALFVLVGNYILEIKNMWFEYWLILFSTSCFANLLGLNISASFNSAKVIYILIPIMIIPQLLFSGVIVRFDKLNPILSKEKSVPWIGNLMASRWAYEALAVTQFKRNKFETHLFWANQQRSEAEWKRDFWLNEMNNRLNFIVKNNDKSTKKQEVNNAYTVLKNEIQKEELRYDPSMNFNCNGCIPLLEKQKITMETKSPISNYLEVLSKIYKNEVLETIEKQNQIINDIGQEKLKSLKENHFNQALSNFVTNRNDFDKIVETNGYLIQKKDPIYNIPRNSGFFEAHFYSPIKQLYGQNINTFVANILVLWGMTLILVLTLCVDFFRKLITLTENFNYKLKRKK